MKDEKHPFIIISNPVTQFEMSMSSNKKFGLYFNSTDLFIPATAPHSLKRLFLRLGFKNISGKIFQDV